MAPILTHTDKGIYCAAGDFWIDPWRPVPRALITHGHADHARPGMGAYLATHAALPVLRHRLGEIDAEGISYGETRRIGAASVSFHPAGHVPGSAQIRVEVAGEVWVVSGDYKVEPDGLSEPFEPVRCHHFITECTFGLPVFRWQPQATVMAQVNDWWRANASAGTVSMLGAYSLGKAQRLIANIDAAIGPILTHGAVEATNAVLRAQGYDLPDTIHWTSDAGKPPRDALVIAPPGALDGQWARAFGTRSTAFASGWMGVRGIRRRRAGDRGFVISDHADWPGLLSAIRDTGAENVYPTHGYTDIFARYLSSELGLNAQVWEAEYGGDDAEEVDAA
ncbi:ligase-associated DNA damage response exonuclease [Pseudaestuariivita atlantica]|uniref:mRNA 3'-end processing factor n=1 Tax=Pseudaestuariivita atlantica TaxID=1317121 RepID=A0A0L1JQI9_9RHOB|nr:ligase-associated DNA damage response exonuclease [Pseudaestuariivita atlantica]KNG93996.1 mRNA 3'-end processing factor [Pseudaestuariivita atlantica]